MSPKPQKILIISTVHQPFDVRIFEKEAMTLARAGYDVSVAMATGGHAWVNGVRVLPLGAHGGPKLDRLFRNLRAMRYLLLHRGIVHIHDPELLILALLAWITRRTIVYDIHEYYNLKFAERDANSQWIPGRLKPLVAASYAALERMLLPQISGIIVVTPDMANDYARLVSPEKIILVRNLPAIADSDIEAARKAASPLPGRYFVHTGGASRSRDFKTLVESAELLRQSGYCEPIINLGEIRLKDYGSIEAADLERRAKAVDIRNLGRVSYGELLRWLAHAYIGLVLLQASSNHEKALPTKLFEYLAFGLPIVCTNIGVGARIVDEHQLGVTVQSGDAAAYAAAYISLLDDKNMKSRCSNASLQASKLYRFDEDAARLIAFYGNITAAIRRQSWVFSRFSRYIRLLK